MESKSKRISLRTILIVIATGVWVIVFQNAGVIPTNQHVKVVKTVDTHSQVSGEVEIENTVDSW